jgi:hypothetical protein
MKKEIILSIVIVGTLFLVGIYFVPKTTVVCDSALPIQCREYRCERGFIYNPTPFGGIEAKCFLGGVPTFNNTDFHPK